MPPRQNDRHPLRILIIGYYGRLNAGDDLLQQAMAYVFQDHNLTFSSWTPGISWMNDCDLIVVGGGSIWPGYAVFQHAAALSRRLRVPLMVIGISAKKADDPLLEPTMALAKQSPFFHVRDQSTHALFTNSPHVRVGADLFWWMPWYGRKDLGSLERPGSVALSLRDWPDIPWDPQSIVARLREQALQIRPFPLHLGSAVHSPNSDLNDAQFLRGIGLTDVTDYFDLNALLQAEVCVAMRFHAILMSTRLGIPVIGLGFHPKIQAFFAEHGMPELCVPLDDPEAFSTALEQLCARYRHYTTVFADLAERLEQQGRDDLDACTRALSQIRPRAPQGVLHRALRRLLD